VKFCDGVPEEKTGASTAGRDFLANMRTHQRGGDAG
jgi:hypothetical protein